jgi:hypothetical protein
MLLLLLKARLPGFPESELVPFYPFNLANAPSQTLNGMNPIAQSCILIVQG